MQVTSYFKRKVTIGFIGELQLTAGYARLSYFICDCHPSTNYRYFPFKALLIFSCHIT